MADPIARATVRIDPDLDFFRAELQGGLEAIMAGISNPQVTIGVDDSQANATLAGASTRLQAFGTQSATATLGVDEEPLFVGLDKAVAGVEAFAKTSATAHLFVGDEDLFVKLPIDLDAIDAFGRTAATASLFVDDGEVFLKLGEATAALDAFAAKDETAKLELDTSGFVASLAAATVLAGLAKHAIGGAGGDGGGLGSAFFGSGSAIPFFGATAAFGTAGSILGFGAEHAITAAVGVIGSAIGAAIGGALQGLGALGVGAVGFGTDLAGIGQAAGDIKNVYGPLQSLNGAIAQYGSISSQAVTAQNNLNTALQGFSPLAQAAVLSAANTVSGFRTMFDQVSGLAEVTGAQILQQAVLVGEQFLPTIGRFATQNLGIIQKDIQPLFDWLTSPDRWGGLGIFTNLEQIFQRDLPAGVGALTNGLELFFKTVDIAAQHVGNFVQKLDAFFTKMNTTDFGAWSNWVNNMIGLFQTWVGLIVSVGRTIFDIFMPAVGAGKALVSWLTGIFDQIDQWLTSGSMVSALHDLFAVHLVELIQGIGGVIKGLLPFFEGWAQAFIHVVSAGAGLASLVLIPIGDALQIIAKIPFLTTIVGWTGALLIAVPAFAALATALTGIAGTAIATAWGAIAGGVDLVVSAVTGAGALLAGWWASLAGESATGAGAVTAATTEIDGALDSTIAAGQAASVGLAEHFAEMAGEAQATADSVTASMAEVDAALGSTGAAGAAGAAGAGAKAAGTGAADVAGATAAGGVTAIGADAGIAAGGVGALSGALDGVIGALGGLVIALPLGYLALAALSTNSDSATGSLKGLVDTLKALPTKSLPEVQGALHATGDAIDTLKGKITDLQGKQVALEQANRGSASTSGIVVPGTDYSNVINQLYNTRNALSELQTYYKQLQQDQTDYGDNTKKLAGILGISKANVDQLAQSLGINLAQSFDPKWIGTLEGGLQSAAAQAGVTTTGILNTASATQYLGYQSQNAALSIQTAFQNATGYVDAFGSAGVSATQIAQNMVKAGQDAASAWSTFSNSATGITTYVQNINTAQTGVTNAGQGLAQAQQSLASAQATYLSDLASGSSADVLAGAKDSITAAQAQVSTAQGTLNTAQTSLTNAQNGVSNSLNITAGEIAKFFTNQTTLASTFASNINKALAEGYNPQLIAQIEAQGPQQGAQYLQTLVSDATQSVSGYTGTLKDIVNAGVSSLQQAGEAAVIQAQFTQIAVGAAESKTAGLAAQYAQEFASAVGLQTLIVQNATTGQIQAYIDGLQGGLPEAQQIATDYGIKLPDGLKNNTANAGTAGAAQAGAAAAGIGDPTAKTTAEQNAHNLAETVVVTMKLQQWLDDAQGASEGMAAYFASGLGNPSAEDGVATHATNLAQTATITFGLSQWITSARGSGAGIGQNYADAINSPSTTNLAAGNAAALAGTVTDTWNQKQLQDNAAAAGANFGHSFAFGMAAALPNLRTAAALTASQTLGAFQNWLGAQSPAKKVIPVGHDFVDGFIVGMEQRTSAVGSAAASVAVGTLGAIRNAIGAHSPATEAVPIGQALMDGFAQGMTQGQTNAVVAARQATQAVQDALAQGLSGSSLDNVVSNFWAKFAGLAQSLAPTGALQQVLGSVQVPTAQAASAGASPGATPSADVQAIALAASIRDLELEVHNLTARAVVAQAAGDPTVAQAALDTANAAKRQIVIEEQQLAELKIQSVRAAEQAGTGQILLSAVNNLASGAQWTQATGALGQQFVTVAQQLDQQQKAALSNFTEAVANETSGTQWLNATGALGQQFVNLVKQASNSAVSPTVLNSTVNTTGSVDTQERILQVQQQIRDLELQAQRDAATGNQARAADDVQQINLLKAQLGQLEGAGKPGQFTVQEAQAAAQAAAVAGSNLISAAFAPSAALPPLPNQSATAVAGVTSSPNVSVTIHGADLSNPAATQTAVKSAISQALNEHTDNLLQLVGAGQRST